MISSFTKHVFSMEFHGHRKRLMTNHLEETLMCNELLKYHKTLVVIQTTEEKNH